MNVDQTLNINRNKDRNSTNSDLAYEDDGFFSDVPTAGSLSRSQLALNKFMKKNLLYEENEYENDRAYFSKESTPNESVTKYDSDSARSNESTERKQALKTVRIVETHIGHDSNFNLSTIEPIKEQNSASETYTKHNPSPTPPIRKTIKENVDVTKLTDDFKYKQLRDHLNNNSHKKSVIRIEYSDVRNEPSHLQASHRAASLDDFTVDYGTAIDDTQSESIVMREKRSVVKREENRHTIHDVSEWVNRTNVYPDVYAPLPYSKYRYLQYHVLRQPCELLIR